MSYRGLAYSLRMQTRVEKFSRLLFHLHFWQRVDCWWDYHGSGEDWPLAAVYRNYEIDNLFIAWLPLRISCCFVFLNKKKQTLQALVGYWIVDERSAWWSWLIVKISVLRVIYLLVHSLIGYLIILLWWLLIVDCSFSGLILILPLWSFSWLNQWLIIVELLTD